MTAPAAMRTLVTTQCAHAHALAQLDAAFEDAADIDLDVLTGELAQVEARRVGQAHARVHQARPGELPDALERGELRGAVDQATCISSSITSATTGVPSSTAMRATSVR